MFIQLTNDSIDQGQKARGYAQAPLKPSRLRTLAVENALQQTRRSRVVGLGKTRNQALLVGSDQPRELAGQGFTVAGEPQGIGTAIAIGLPTHDRFPCLQRVDYACGGRPVETDCAGQGRLLKKRIRVDHHQHSEQARCDRMCADGFLEVTENRQLCLAQLIADQAS